MHILTGFRSSVRALVPCLALTSSLLIAGCGGDDDADSSQTGTASFSIKDAPVDGVSEVVVTFDRIDLKPRNGAVERFELDPPRTVDLLALQGTDAAALIDAVELPSGQYDWMRLYVVTDGSEVVEVLGGEFDLFIPGSHPPSSNPNQRFLHLARPFVIPAGGHADFTVDVELRKALIKRTSGPGSPFYMLRPSLRLVDNFATGTLTGTAPHCTSDLSSGGNAVYVYEGAGAVPGDVFVGEDGDELLRSDGADHPLTLANVTLDTESGLWRYTVGFLPAGVYSIAFTCQAREDEPGSQDDIGLSSPTDVTITAGETFELNLD